MIKKSLIILFLIVAAPLWGSPGLLGPVTLMSESTHDRQIRYKHILLRDFRKGRNGFITNYNIGTTAHCPSTIASLRKSLPGDVEITVWADNPLEPVLIDMMERRWPEVEIVYGKLDSTASEDLLEAVEKSDLLLVSSGSSVAGSVQTSLKQYKAMTGKPVAAYAIGSAPAELVSMMDFIWYRDEKALDKAEKSGGQPEIYGFAPDAVFDFDSVDDESAVRFLKDNGLYDERFICCLSGYRNTPTWEYFGGTPDARKASANAEKVDMDNGIVREMICQAVREEGVKVLVCAEQVPELRLIKDVVYDRLPEDVKEKCVVLDTLWSPQMALGVYRRSAAVAGIEMHSQVMSLGNGVPAVILRHPGFGSKSDMWNTVGAGCWLIDIDDADACRKACMAVKSILEDPAGAEKVVFRAREIIDSTRNAALSRSFYTP